MLTFDYPIPPYVLYELLDHSPLTGKLFWKKRNEDWFATRQHMNWWNNQFAGVEALTAWHNGYKRGRILRRPYLAHRVMWAMETGGWPSLELNHIDRVKHHNWLSNLRDVTRAQQNRNVSLRVDNPSGYAGIRQVNGDWLAYAGASSKRENYLGKFDTIEEALLVRKAALIARGFSETHGQ